MTPEVRSDQLMYARQREWDRTKDWRLSLRDIISEEIKAAIEESERQWKIKMSDAVTSVQEEKTSAVEEEQEYSSGRILMWLGVARDEMNPAHVAALQDIATDIRERKT